MNFLCPDITYLLIYLLSDVPKKIDEIDQFILFESNILFLKNAKIIGVGSGEEERN